MRPAPFAFSKVYASLATTACTSVSCWHKVIVMQRSRHKTLILCTRRTIRLCCSVMHSLQSVSSCCYCYCCCLLRKQLLSHSPLDQDLLRRLRPQAVADLPLQQAHSHLPDVRQKQQSSLASSASRMFASQQASETRQYHVCKSNICRPAPQCNLNHPTKVSLASIGNHRHPLRRESDEHVDCFFILV
jgi:hypothetical protein